MEHKEHLTDEGLCKILAIRASMNRGLTPPKLKTAFPSVIPVISPLVLNKKKLKIWSPLPSLCKFLTEGGGGVPASPLSTYSR